MRILLLAPYPPYPPRGGGALRMYHMVRELARRHEVHVLTFVPDAASDAALQPLRSYAHVTTVPGLRRRSLLQRARTTVSSPLPDMALRNHSPHYMQTLRNLLQDVPCDVVQVASIEMGGYRQVAEQLRPAHGKRPPRWVLDEFNAEYVLQRRVALTSLQDAQAWVAHHLLPSFQRADTAGAGRSSHSGNAQSLPGAVYSLVQWRKLAGYERRLLRTFDHVLAVSAEDRRALQQLAPTTAVSIIPNGVDTTFFAPDTQMAAPTACQQPTLVFTGTLDFRPNVDAMTWFVRRVLPLVQAQCPSIRLMVVGRNPLPAVQALHDSRSVEVVGEVDDVRPYIQHAQVYIVPMRMGGGVRLKLLEALAMQVPVVSTWMGAEGVPELRSGTHLLCAEQPEHFAAAILLLLNTPRLRQQMGIQGRTLVCQHYDWRVIVPTLEHVYATMREEQDMV